ncbi:MAG: zinc dependent phospholipase C family protein [Bacillota bacterium]|nr:zinc dependent phospholipase C family protein [Bacillota bacterium]
MSGRVEKAYGSLLKCMRYAVDPFKKALIVTECKVHCFINMQALEIIKADEYQDAYMFFSDYAVQLNEGVIWADQNLKSMGHFYNPYSDNGLYGNTDAVSLASEYYQKALFYWENQDPENSIFYLGASLHLVQDVTVPHHANIRLLDNHRRFEDFVRRTYQKSLDYKVSYGGYYYMKTIEEAVRCNAHNAIRIYSRLQKIEDEEKRYEAITKFTLPLAQRTTAGCLVMFYRKISGGMKLD